MLKEQYVCDTQLSLYQAFLLYIRPYCLRSTNKTNIRLNRDGTIFYPGRMRLMFTYVLPRYVVSTVFGGRRERQWTDARR